MKTSFLTALVMIFPAFHARADLADFLVNTRNSQAGIEWSARVGLTDKVIDGICEALTKKGKAKEPEVEARAAAFFINLSAADSGLTAKPLEAVRSASLPEALDAGSTRTAGVVSFLEHASLPKDGHCFDGESLLEDAGDLASVLKFLLTKWYLPRMIKRPVISVGIYSRMEALQKASKARCAPDDSLFEDFESGTTRNLMAWAEDAKGATVIARVVEGVAFDGKHSLALSGKLKGWGFGCNFHSSYVLPEYKNKTKFVMQVKTDVPIHFSWELWDGNRRGGEGQGYEVPSASLVLRPSPEWQKVSFPFSSMTRKAGETVTPKSSSVKPFVPAALRKVVFYVAGPEAEKANIYLDHVTLE